MTGIMPGRADRLRVDRLRIGAAVVAALGLLLGLFVVLPRLAHAQTGPTLTVQTSQIADPNGTVVLDIVLDPAGETITAVVFDILFDATKLTNTAFENVLPAGGAFNLSSGQVRDGVFYTIDPFDPDDPGGFATQTVVARITLQGQELVAASPVNLVALEAFAADESPLTIDVVGGGVTVVDAEVLPPTPTPTPGTPPTVTPTPTPTPTPVVQLGPPPILAAMSPAPFPPRVEAAASPPASVQLAYPGPIKVVPESPTGGTAGFRLNPQPEPGALPADTALPGSSTTAGTSSGSTTAGRGTGTGIGTGTGTGTGTTLANTGPQTAVLTTASILLATFGGAFMVLARRKTDVLR